MREAKIQVLGQLLGDGAAPVDGVPRLQIHLQGIADVLDIVSAVAIEGAVLQLHQQIDLSFGDLGERNEIRLSGTALIQGKRRPLFHQDDGIARDTGTKQKYQGQNDQDRLQDDQLEILRYQMLYSLTQIRKT